MTAAASVDGVLRTPAAQHPDDGDPGWGTRLCRAAVRDVRARTAGADAVPGPRDAEFETVLVRRLAERHLRTVADHAAGAPVAQVWQLLLDAPPAPAARLALAAARALRDHDLALAFVGAATLLGRPAGVRERAGHQRVAAALGRCLRELTARPRDAGAAAEAARFDDAAARRAAWLRAEHLWAVRGRPVEAEHARRALDRAVRLDAAHLLFAA